MSKNREKKALDCSQELNTRGELFKEMRHLSDMVGGVNLIYVGRLETDSSKGTFACRVWDCLQLWAVKTPDTFE